MRGKRQRRRRSAFTLLEILTVAVVIAILALLLIPAISSMRARAQRVECMANLRSLYVAAESYLQQNGSWPQIAATDSEEDDASAWIAAFSPFGVTQKNWICPTIQNALGNPDLSDTTNVRTDYIPMHFDSKPLTPHLWPGAPWFIEVGNMHETGNLIIFSDGSIKGSLELPTAPSPFPTAAP